MQNFKEQNQIAVETMTRGFVNAIDENNWIEADKFLDMMILYQEKLEVQ